jgi:sugar/nucleoside kinase (ribokinase family)
MPRGYDVAVLHDFFVDRLVHARSIGRLQKLVQSKADEGGGGLHGIGQAEIRGGNAVNLAHALARLGVRTLIITHSDEAHRGLLTETFKGLDAEVRVKPLRPGLTVALEGRVNVMLGDTRGASDFGPSTLDGRDWEALARARVVCSVNWAANRRGTELLLALRKRLGKEKTIFFDPADFRDRLPQFRKLLKLVADKGLADWISMNQQEGAAAARLLGVESGSLGRACMELAKRLGVVFDLHAERESYTSEGTEVTRVAVKKAKARRLTGAGDVWDAGGIYGRLKRMEEKDRLNFANTAARLYLESAEPVPPTLSEVKKALG